MQAAYDPQAPADAGPLASAEGHAEVSLGVQIGRLASVLEQDRQRRQLMSQLVNIIDIPPLDFTVAAGVASYKAYRSGAPDMSPSEGMLWFVQRVSVAGLNAGDLVNLFRTTSVPAAARTGALHLFTGPAGVAAGLGVADWEPGGTGLTLRPDDQLFLASAGTLVASELVMTGQAIQVDLRILAEYLL